MAVSVEVAVEGSHSVTVDLGLDASLSELRGSIEEGAGVLEGMYDVLVDGVEVGLGSEGKVADLGLYDGVLITARPNRRAVAMGILKDKKIDPTLENLVGSEDDDTTMLIIESGEVDPLSALKVISEGGSLVVVEKFLECNPLMAEADNGLLLFSSATSGDLSVVKHLLESHKVAVDPHDTDGFTPLCHAAMKGQLSIVQYLLKSGADVGDDVSGSTPLQLAAEEGRVQVVEELLKGGAGCEIEDDHTGATPLTTALQEGHTEVAELLLENGADPNHEGPMGSPLSMVIHHSPALTQRLLSHGASTDPTTDCYHSLLDYFVSTSLTAAITPAMLSHPQTAATLLLGGSLHSSLPIVSLVLRSSCVEDAVVKSALRIATGAEVKSALKRHNVKKRKREDSDEGRGGKRAK